MASRAHDAPPPPEIATLLARLHLQVPPPPGMPEPGPGARNGEREQDLAVWQALGSAGRLILRQVVAEKVPRLPLPTDSTRPARYSPVPGRFAAGRPLRLLRRVIHLRQNGALAGAMAVLATLGDRSCAHVVARLLTFIEPDQEPAPLLAGVWVYFRPLGRLGVELLTRVALDSTAMAEGRHLAMGTLRRLADDDPQWRRPVIDTLCTVLANAREHYPFEVPVATVAVMLLREMRATSALPAIRAAYAARIIDTSTVPWEGVRQALELHPPHRGGRRRRR